VSAPAVAHPRAFALGRPFLDPLSDTLLIGGGLSLLVLAALALSPELRRFTDMDLLMPAVLAANCAHFAASTVRLYAMPGATKRWPFLTLVFPLASLAALTLAIALGEWLGVHFQALYLTWSPYHYAAQAYGLALMYCVRSGTRPTQRERRLLRAACMLPFAYAFLSGAGIGVDWLLPREVAVLPFVEAPRRAALALLRPVVLLAPLLLFARMARSASGPLPFISLVTLVSNGVWWTLLEPIDAFVWATIFHGIQYLAIVMVFHARDRLAAPGNRHGAAWHALSFYAASLVLGYLLFRALPFFYVAAGFGLVESTLLVVAAINLHHFVVDAFIWRFSKGGSNRQIVDGAPAPG
jgi:hypothetical protein